jgi:RNA polymerase sigma factor (sigma-70 family)
MSDFHLLLEEHIPALMRYTRALTRDADQASELIEDTVMTALAHRREWCKSDDIRVWLLTTVHDLRSNPFRQGIHPESGADLDATALLTLSDLDRAMGQLPEEQRAIILLIGLEGMSYAETASILRIPVSAMRFRLARARTGLRRAVAVAGTPATARAAA